LDAIAETMALADGLHRGTDIARTFAALLPALLAAQWAESP
jgi:hypothetical protein